MSSFVLSGDVHVILGLLRIRVLIMCGKRGRRNQKSIQCDHCEQWFHARCTGIKNEEYFNLTQPELNWESMSSNPSNTMTQQSPKGDINFQVLKGQAGSIQSKHTVKVKIQFPDVELSYSAGIGSLFSMRSMSFRRYLCKAE